MLPQFIIVFIINAFTLVVFARSRHLRRRNTYLIMNLTVADLLIAAVSGPETILFFIPNKRPKKGFGVLYLIISDMCWIASLGNLVLISLERLHATLYPFRHCLLGKCKLSPVRSIGDNDFLRVISWACWYYHPLLVLVNYLLCYVAIYIC